MASAPVPTLSKKELKRSLKAKTNKPVRNALCTPYKVTWPNIESSTQDAILKELVKSFTERNLKNPLAENMCYRKLKKADRQSKKEEVLSESNQSPEELNLRTQLLFGVMEITRSLERDQLRLVIIDRSSPWQLHRHVAQLSAVRGCPAMAIDRISDKLSPLVSVTRMCALGFKVLKDGDSNYFDGLVDFIAVKCLPIELPWLDCENVLQAVKSEAMATKEVEEMDQLEPSGDNEIKSVDDDETEMKDYSYLYIAKKSETKVTVAKKSKDIWKLEETEVIDDMWGISEEKLQRRKSGTVAPANGIGIKNIVHPMESLETDKKSKKGIKRMYQEVDIVDTTKNSKKKIKKI